MKEQKEDGTFSSLEVDIYEVLSPDYPTARADMIVEYVHHSFTTYRATHHTSSQLLIETSCVGNRS